MPDRTTVGDESRYPIRVVIARTGLTADVLRAWERRYGAVHPQRSAGGQRLYSEEDVTRLTLLRRATLAGHSIAEVARLRTEALEALVDEPRAAAERAAADMDSAVVRSALAAAERLDGPALEATLKRAALALGTGFVDRIAPRLLTEVERTARALPRGTTLFAGGRATNARTNALRDAGVRVLPDIPALQRTLRMLRGRAGNDDATGAEA